MQNLNGIEAIKYIKDYFRSGEDGTNEIIRGVTSEEAGALICYDIMSILRNSIKNDYELNKETKEKFEQIHNIIENKFDNLIDILKESNIYITDLEKKYEK